MSRRNESLSARRGDGEARYLTIPRPNAYEGVGKALRCAYRQPESGMPSELTDLLGKLNQIRH